MKLAVILPAYNAENFIAECLESLLNQTFSDFCILAVNDASTDNTGKILETYAAKDTRLRVYHLPMLNMLHVWMPMIFVYRTVLKNKFNI